MTLIKKTDLDDLKFTEITSATRTRGTEFEHQPFRVVLFEDDEENPEISMIIKGTQVFFPGAYSLKDLKDLLFFFYGEENYTFLFGHLPIEIIE